MIFVKFCANILIGTNGGKIILIQPKKEIPKGKLLVNATMSVFTQGNLIHFLLPYAVVENENDIHQTELGEQGLHTLWRNATITDFGNCIDPLGDSSIIYL